MKDDKEALEEMQAEADKLRKALRELEANIKLQQELLTKNKTKEKVEPK